MNDYSVIVTAQEHPVKGYFSQGLESPSGPGFTFFGPDNKFYSQNFIFQQDTLNDNWSNARTICDTAPEMNPLLLPKGSSDE